MLTNVHIFKAMIFPIVMYRCESWTLRKAEQWRIDTFELWCWRRLLWVPWTARRSNQSILKEINPEYSLEGLMLILKLQCFGHLMWRADSLEKTLMLARLKAGGEGATEDEKIGWYHWLSWHEFEQTSGDGEGQGSQLAAVYGITKNPTWLKDWTTTTSRMKDTDNMNMSLDAENAFDKMKPFHD